MKNTKKTILFLWLIIAFIASIAGLVEYFSNRGKSVDVSVSETTTCYGGCLYFGLGNYPVGTKCRGARPGDPGYATGEDFSNRCWVCGSNGQFSQQDLGQCNVCYGQCLGDPAPTQYNTGQKCAVGTGSNYGIYTCDMGVWVKDTPATKCAGSCPGDGPYTLYDLGHRCLSGGQCYECKEPGREAQGGFDVVDSNLCTVPAQQTCRAKCQFDLVENEYQHDDECQAGAGTADYGTYRCNNGTWEKASVQKCVGQAPGDRPGTLYDSGEYIEWVGKCYQCTTPGREFQGGFDVVDPAICGLNQIGGNEAHAQAGVCLGDLNGSGSVDLNDFSNFAKYFNTTLTELWYYDITTSDAQSVLNLNDFALFARNFGKDVNSCQKRTETLQKP